MRILHYFLGSHRQGGLNRYAADLAAAQAAAGHRIFGLFPGGSILPRRPCIRRRKMAEGVEYYELLGGVPVPLLEGIRDPGMILNASARRLPDSVLRVFCDRVRPDVLHIHTWMGFPPELLYEMKRRNVRVVFSTHDYFGLCPRVNFIDDTGELCVAPDNGKCSRCNRHAPGARYLALRNWGGAMKFKVLLKPLRHLRRRRTAAEPETAIRDYAALRKYYRELLTNCDKIHFNSGVSAAVYRRFLPEVTGRVIPIVHRGIADRREVRRIGNGKVRLCFIGSAAPYKGLPMLLNALRQLRERGIVNWQLNVWGTDGTDRSIDMEQVKYRGSFSPKDQSRVWKEADLLIVPSICWETFGFVVVEALAAGLPVLCSDMVGAQILLEPDMVYHDGAGLSEALTRLLSAPELLEEVSRNICLRPEFETMSGHVEVMDEFYHSANIG